VDANVIRFFVKANPIRVGESSSELKENCRRCMIAERVRKGDRSGEENHWP